jgi:hypothetical protein
MGKPSPHGALGIDDGPPAPAPELPLPLPELPPPEPPLPEPPLDAALLAPLLVVVLDVAPVSLQYVGSWVQSCVVEVPAVCAEADTAHSKITLACPKPNAIHRLGRAEVRTPQKLALLIHLLSRSQSRRRRRPPCYST